MSDKYINISFENSIEVKTALQKQPEKVKSMVVHAINRAADTALSSNKYPSITKEIAKRYTISQQDLRGNKTKNEVGILSVTQASTNRLYATINVPSRHLSLSHFKLNPKTPSPGSPPKGGYKFQIMRGGKWIKMPRGFLAYANNSLQYFQRTSTSRFPVKRITGPSIPQMLRPDAAERVTQGAKTVMDERLEHELKRVLAVKKV
jgi:hypothetical protein